MIENMLVYLDFNLTWNESLVLKHYTL